MRNFKRFLTLALAVLMVVSAFAFSTSAAAFTDVDADDEYLAKAVNLLNYVGVVKGTSETTFGTDELVTREQMAAFIYRLMKKGQSVENGVNTSSFTDLEDPTFYFMVSWAASQDIIKGTSATTFNPKGSITLQDAYTMVVRALGYETEDALPYPFGYIGVAEDKNVALDEGLDSSVTYTDALTRGDVAIILYNAFFAETGVAETKQYEDYIGDDKSGNWVLRTETVYPVFCEKYFDVLEVEYQLIATPGYQFGSADATTKSFGYDAMHFQLREFEGEEDVPSEFYADFADLGLEGKADDYIMSHFKMYVTLDKDDEIDEILYAEPLMTKKTVEEIGFETLTTNTKNSYFVTGDTDSAKLLTGKVTLDDEVAYFFNAPYAYAKPNYRTNYNVNTTSDNAVDDGDKYIARNAENLEIISLALKSNSDDEYVYSTKFTLYDDTLAATDVAALDTANYATYAADVVEELAQAYVGGLYSADVWDVDGDGLYDYMLYKPYSFAIADDNNKKDFVGDYFDTNGQYGDYTLYIGEATMTGEEVADGDAFIGWLNKDANIIEVAAVVEPVETDVTNVKTNGTLTLGNGDTVNVTDAWKFLDQIKGDIIADDGSVSVGKVDENYLAGVGYNAAAIDWKLTGLYSASLYDEDEIELYIYDGAVLYAGDIETQVSYNGENLIIITPDEDGATWGEEWTANVGKTLFANAYVDGEIKYVPVETDTDKTDIFPAVVKDDTAYVNKVATYTVDKNGVYTIQMLGNATSEAGEDLALEALNKVDFTDSDDASLQGYVEFTSGEYTLVEYSNKRYELLASDGSEALPMDLLINDKTLVLIRNEYDKDDKNDADANGATGNDTVDFVEYTVADLTDSIKNTLGNVQIVVQNNTKYEGREDLVLLFAETTDNKKLNLTTAKSNKADRIVKGVEVIKNADGDFQSEYTVYNPYTGATETVLGVATSTSSNNLKSAAIGEVVVLESGKVADEGSYTTYGSLKDATAANGNLYWVVGYDAEEEMIEVVKYDSNAANTTTGAASEDDVVYATFSKNETYKIGIENAPVVVLKRPGQGWDFGYTTISVGEAAGLEGEDEDYLAFNSAYAPIGSDADDELETVYGRYVKVYLNIDVANDGSLSAGNTDSDTGFHGEVEYVVVVANENENAAYCAVKDI